MNQSDGTGSAVQKSKKKRTSSGNDLQAEILTHAEKAFAEYGYEGTSIATIAESIGISKQNLLYYFPSKQNLYKRVLDDVLGIWLESMALLADETRNPQEALTSYIQAKLRFSREHPWGSRVYGLEVITGARFYRNDIRAKVVPVLQKDILVFEKWIAEGKIAPVDPTHLLFTIWAMTQSYADFSTQMSLVLNRKKLTAKDFDAAEKLILDIVLAAIAPKVETVLA